jgi:hypothetical protein
MLTKEEVEMSALFSTLRTVRTVSSRFVRGFLLIVWICGLSLVALGSLEGSLANLILSRGLGAQSEGPRFYSMPRFDQQPGALARCLTGPELLTRFRLFQDKSPPIDALLDVILPNWATIRRPSSGQCTDEEDQTEVQAYQSLFSKVAERMRSIARSESTDLKTFVVDVTILPPEFQSTLNSSDIKLPLEVQDWVVQERTRIKASAQAHALVGTFLLLSVLGAFGALIFLIRDYITLDEERTLGDYLFRPVLGIFLAVAVFVVDVLAHSIISTSSILEIRYEPLYILALGAGLLSEKAYDWVRHNADQRLLVARKMPQINGKYRLTPACRPTGKRRQTQVVLPFDRYGHNPGFGKIRPSADRKGLTSPSPPPSPAPPGARAGAPGPRGPYRIRWRCRHLGPAHRPASRAAARAASS